MEALVHLLCCLIGNSVARLTLKADVGVAKLEVPLKVCQQRCRLGQVVMFVLGSGRFIML